MLVVIVTVRLCGCNQVGDLLHTAGTSYCDLQTRGKKTASEIQPGRDQPGVALWKPRGTVRNSLLIEAILDADETSRKSIMQTKVHIELYPNRMFVFFLRL